jgi:hypothetical protein
MSAFVVSNHILKDLRRKHSRPETTGGDFVDLGGECSGESDQVSIAESDPIVDYVM